MVTGLAAQPGQQQRSTHMGRRGGFGRSGGGGMRRASGGGFGRQGGGFSGRMARPSSSSGRYARQTYGGGGGFVGSGRGTLVDRYRGSGQWNPPDWAQATRRGVFDPYGGQGGYGGYGQSPYGDPYGQAGYGDPYSGLGGGGMLGGLGGGLLGQLLGGLLNPGPYTGVGPKGYTRSDERISDDVSDLLAAHGQLDAREIDVRVENGEVILEGTVEDRQAKRLAEDLAERVPGVQDVQNRLKTRQKGGVMDWFTD